jgi:hypothetical protein
MKKVITTHGPKNSSELGMIVPHEQLYRTPLRIMYDFQHFSTAQFSDGLLSTGLATQFGLIPLQFYTRDLRSE